MCVHVRRGRELWELKGITGQIHSVRKKKRRFPDEPKLLAVFPLSVVGFLQVGDRKVWFIAQPGLL